MAPGAYETELILRIDLRADPITGSLTAPEGACEHFRGWIGLAAALERIRAREGRKPGGDAAT